MAKLASAQTPKSALINVMSQAAYKAAKGLIRDLGELENLQITRKSVADFVSAADKRSEDIIIDELKKARPKFAFLCEERGVIRGADEKHRWIVDPLDGTTNFLHGMPFFAISIGLEFDGEIIAGVVYQPVTDEMFWAEKGKGAFCNQRRLRVANRTDLDTLLIDVKSKAVQERYSLNLDKIGSHRTLGACALSMVYVAAGRFDGCFILNAEPWDFAAATIIIQEAGGEVVFQNETLPFGDKQPWLVAGNSQICEILKPKNNVTNPATKI